MTTDTKERMRCVYCKNYINITESWGIEGSESKENWFHGNCRAIFLIGKEAGMKLSSPGRQMYLIGLKEGKAEEREKLLPTLHTIRASLPVTPEWGTVARNMIKELIDELKAKDQVPQK